ncbi:unnamed protein product [Symbiodinium sp. CCMP2456]|nr:unnamed protein product [Symbiodinium sp. CCMP2456]
MKCSLRPVECRRLWLRCLVVLSATFMCSLAGHGFCRTWAQRRSVEQKSHDFRIISNAKGFGDEGIRSPKSTRCPCLSGKHYKVCCRQIHKDLTAADTPEKMARARFSALAMKKYDFLIDTTHSTHVDFQEDRQAWKKQIVRNNRGFRYIGLNVTASEQREEDLYAVTIEAAAEPEKVSDVPKVLLLQECSVYRREGETWKYVAAEGLKREVVEGAGSAQQLVFFVIADFCICRGTRQLWILLWLGLLISINEVVVKKCFAEPRPGSRLELRGEHGRLQGSCIMTCGMPSSHSAIAMGWFTLSILDATVRTHLGTSRQATVTGGRITHTQSILMAEQKKIVHFMKNFCLVPWVKKDVLNVRELISFGLFWFFLMVPVPFMRVVLCDHTPNQVAVGSTLGLVLAVLWWRAVRVLQRRFRNLEGRQICYGLLWHDYFLPVPEHEEILRRQQQLELGQTRQPPLRTF